MKRFIYIIVIILFACSTGASGQIINVRGATMVFNGATVQINGSLRMASGSNVTQTGGEVYITGEWTDSSGFAATGGRVNFTGSTDRTITGSAPSTFWNLRINKNSGNILGLDQNADVDNNLAVAGGIFRYYNTRNGTQAAQTLNVAGSISVANNAEFSVRSTGAQSLDNILRVAGNISNDGIFAMRPIADNPNYKAKTIFNGTSDQQLTGTSPDLTRFFDVELDMGNVNRKVICNINTGISKVTAGDAINFINGTWNQTANTTTMDDGVATKFDHTIHQNGIISLTGSGNFTTGASLYIDGGQISLSTSGQATIGSEIDANLICESTADWNEITISAGTLVVAGRISRSALDNNIRMLWTQSAGTARVGTYGHTGTDFGTFDISNSTSVFTMSAGTIELQGRTSAASNVADFYLDPGAFTISTGLVQFGNASTAPSTTFTFDVPGSQSSAASSLYDVTIYNGSILSPFATDSRIRIRNTFTINGEFNGQETRTGATATDCQLIFQGNNGINQNVTGSGVFKPRNITMNRQGGGNRAVIFRLDCDMSGVLDFMEVSNSNNQIIYLYNGVGMDIHNPDVNAIVDHVAVGDNVSQSPLRMVRTSSLSGSLGRELTRTAGVYDYPVGSYTTSYVYSPASVTITQNTGQTAGIARIRVTRGSAADGGHSRHKTEATDYLNRYWTLTLGSGFDTSLDGQWNFYYYDSANEITGQESDINAVGRWDDPFEGGTGDWHNMNEEGASVDISANAFTSCSAANLIVASDWIGDWTPLNLSAFQRIFYSRQSGNWTNINTWSLTSHAGASAGEYPDLPEDSVVIGGGNIGAGNHIITLNTSPTIGGMTLGTGSTNTGTLNCGTNTISGNLFKIEDYSTLGIGSPDGITASAAEGNIRTSSRTYTPSSGYAIFEYNGAANQTIGDGLPPVIRSLIIDNTGGSGNETVTIDRNISIRDDLDIQRGRLDIGQYTVNNSTGAGDFNISADGSLSIGDNNNMNNAVTNYSTYTIDAESYVEFYGGAAAPNQEIPPAPNGGTGYGNVIVSHTGTKFIDSPVIIRGNLYISNTAALLNNAGVNSLEVYGNVINSATIDNDGVIIIGQ